MSGKTGEICIKPIGIIRSPYRSRKSAPKQGFLEDDVSCVDLSPEYELGMQGIVVGDILDLVYWMDRADRGNLFNDEKKKGIFATRGPDRPNPMGITPVEVLDVAGNTLKVKYLDALDGSPVLDIRRSLFDSFGGVKGKKL